MAENNPENWSNYWQGRTAGESGAALVGVGVENDQDIAAFWDDALSGFEKDAPLLDLACGAGSVIRRAESSGFTDLTGADISDAAIVALKDACPTAKGVVCPANETPFKDGAFKIVASQFGFEYAGAERTASEIARLVAPGGLFVALAHKSGSAIEQEVLSKRAEAQAIKDTGFTEAAKTLFTVDKSGGTDAEFAEANKAFRGPQGALLEIARNTGGLAAHLYQGTQQLYERRQSYDLSDMTGWLDGMAAEVDAYVGRMQSMSDAALTTEALDAVFAVLRQTGLTVLDPETLYSGPQKDPIAWIIKANRPVA